MNDNSERRQEIRCRDIAPANEFLCWAVVVLCPLLRLVNGAAVTGDQFAIQITLFVTAFLGAIGLRVYQFWSP